MPRESQQPSATRCEPRPNKGAKCRILLVEDNPADVYMLREALGVGPDGDIDLVTLGDGEEALDYITRSGPFAEAPTPDLVVLDLNLPKLDGIDILRRLRPLEAYRDVPVVVFTSSDSPRDRANALASGATEFLTKPSELDLFLQIGRRLRTYLPSGRGGQC